MTEKNEKPRMSLVRRIRTKIRRGDYDVLTPEMLEKVLRAIARDLRRPPV